MSSWPNNNATLFGLAMLVQTFSFGQQGMVAYTGNREIVVEVVEEGMANVKLTFMVIEGFYIQADKPENEAFIPTVLHVNASPGITPGEIQYPLPVTIRYGEGAEEINVYNGEVSIILPIKILDGASDDLHIKGSLYYQACSKMKCYYPRTVDFAVTVKVRR
jgi:hypothetical protein